MKVLSPAMKRNGIMLITGGAIVKAIQITLNDDWDNVEYWVRKTLKASFQLDAMRDVRVKFGDQKVTLPKVVILGTGWGAMSFLQSLDQSDVDITIVSPRSFFFYTPLLAGTAVGTVRNTSIMEPIRWYFDRSGHSEATFVQASCSDIDVTKKTVYGVDIRGKEVEIDYDYLVVAVGAEPATFGIPGVHENAMFMKEVEDGARVQKRILQRLEAASAILSARRREEEKGGYQKQSHGLAQYNGLSNKEIQEMKRNKMKFDAKRLVEDEEIAALLHWVVVGGGPTGVELVAEMSDFVREDVSKYFPDLSGRVKITLIEASDKILGAFDERMSTYALSALKGRGVNVQCASAVTKITGDTVEMRVKNITEEDSKERRKGEIFVDDSTVAYGALVWAGGIATRPITRAIAANIGSTQSSRWGLEVTPQLAVRGGPSLPPLSVWALGDCAVSGCAPTAQSASQQGKYLGGLFRDTKLDPAEVASYPSFKFVNKGSLAYLGDGKGVAEIRGLWDHYPSREGVPESAVVEGQSAFAIWKSLYFSKIMSGRNRAQVAFDWAQISVFGRDISSSHNIETSIGEAKIVPVKK